MKIVLVDENRETFEVLNEVAQLSGSEIYYFNNIKDAKEFFKENTDVDGLIIEKYVNNVPSGELVSYIKILKLDIPTILLTSDVTEEEKEYFKNLGVTEIIEKPFNPLDVMTAIVAYIKEKKGEEYVKERLQTEENTDRTSLKAIIQKFIEIFKKLLKKTG